MSDNQNLSRLCGGCFGKGLFGGTGIILIILLVIILLGDDFLEFIFCEDNALIWIVLIVLLLTNLDFDGGCGCC